MAKQCPNCNTKIGMGNTLYKCPRCGKVVCKKCAKWPLLGNCKCPFCAQKLIVSKDGI